MNKLLDKLKVQNVPDISAVSMPMGGYTSQQYGAPYGARSPYGGAHPYGQPYYYEVEPPPSAAADAARRYSEEFEKLKQLRATELERQEALKTALTPAVVAAPAAPLELVSAEIKIDVIEP